MTAEPPRTRRRRRRTRPEDAPSPAVAAEPRAAAPAAECPAATHATSDSRRESEAVAGSERRDGEVVAGSERRSSGRRSTGRRERPADLSSGGRDHERGWRDLVGGSPSQVGVQGALRARDVSRPGEQDLAAAERDVVVVRRQWQPPDNEGLPSRPL